MVLFGKQSSLKDYTLYRAILAFFIKGMEGISKKNNWNVEPKEDLLSRRGRKIGVDPYYIHHTTQQFRTPRNATILTRLNDGWGQFAPFSAPEDFRARRGESGGCWVGAVAMRKSDAAIHNRDECSRMQHRARESNSNMC